ncbi:hypothetical protein [Niabella aquatica]
MLLALTVIICIILIIASYRKEELFSHWSQLIPNFKFSTKDFYNLVQKEMISHQVEGLSFREEHIKVGSVFSSKRVYFRVSWENYYYNLCFAPFGDGCFVSWWLFETTSSTQGILSRIPIISQLSRSDTFYKKDTASAFMNYAQNSIMAVLDEITKETGVRISEQDRKPIMKDLFKR